MGRSRRVAGERLVAHLLPEGARRRAGGGVAQPSFCCSNRQHREGGGFEASRTGQPGLEIVGKAASGKEALAEAARFEPDVAVIDVLMPTMSGIECARPLQKRYPARA